MLRRFLVALVLVGGVVAAYQVMPSIGRVSGKALDRSVTEEAGGATSGIRQVAALPRLIA
jgi:hypothetical protein